MLTSINSRGIFSPRLLCRTSWCPQTEFFCFVPISSSERLFSCMQPSTILLFELWVFSESIIKSLWNICPLIFGAISLTRCYDLFWLKGADWCKYWVMRVMGDELFEALLVILLGMFSYLVFWAIIGLNLLSLMSNISQFWSFYGNCNILGVKMSLLFYLDYLWFFWVLKLLIFA